ncbi:MAG: hypothetical protein II225_03110, partial [Ruminococcus sp.]|nr:hypothetical protein [Ruminococcus sp.]
TVCGEELSRETITVDALGHTAGTVVVENNKAPDCENKGSYDNVVYCTVCGEELSRETITVDALGHTAGTVVVENNKAPDCVNKGSYDNVVYCTVCGAELSRTPVTVPATGHNRDGVIAHRDATCTEPGVVGGTYCTVCNEGKAEAETAIPELGHNYGVAVDNGDGTHTKTCANDASHKIVEAHNYVNNECECGATDVIVIAVNGHYDHKGDTLKADILEALGLTEGTVYLWVDLNLSALGQSATYKGYANIEGDTVTVTVKLGIGSWTYEKDVPVPVSTDTILTTLKVPSEAKFLVNGVEYTISIVESRKEATVEVNYVNGSAFDTEEEFIEAVKNSVVVKDNNGDVVTGTIANLLNNVTVENGVVTVKVLADGEYYLKTTYTKEVTWTVKKHTVTFNDENGNFIWSGDFEYGTAPVYGGPDLTDDKYGMGWIDAEGNLYLEGATLPVVSGADTYTLKTYAYNDTNFNGVADEEETLKVVINGIGSVTINGTEYANGDSVIYDSTKDLTIVATPDALTYVQNILLNTTEQTLTYADDYKVTVTAASAGTTEVNVTFADREQPVINGSDVQFEYKDYTNESLFEALGATLVDANGNAIEGAITLDGDYANKAVGTHTVTVKYAGSYCYLPAEATFTLTVVEAPASMTVPNVNVTYGEQYDANPTIVDKNGNDISDDNNLIRFIVGVDGSELELNIGAGEISGYSTKVQILLPESIQKIADLIGLDDGATLTLAQLKEALDKAQKYLGWFEDAKEVIDTLMTTLDSLEDLLGEEVDMNDLEITVGGQYPTGIGVYIQGAVSTNSNYETAFGVGYIIIVPNLDAVQIVDKDGNASNIFTATFDNTAKDLFVSINGEIVDTVDIRYVGVQTNGVTYDSTEAPVHAGIYAVVVTYVAKDGDKIASLGADAAVLVIKPAEATIEITGGKFSCNETANVVVNVTGGNVKPDVTIISGGISGYVTEISVSDFTGVVNMDLPAWMDAYFADYDFYKNGTTPAELISLIDAYREDLLAKIPTDILAKTGFTIDQLNSYIDDLTEIIAEMPDDVTITFEDAKVYTEAGIYAYIGIVTDSDHIPVADTTLVIIGHTNGAIVVENNVAPTCTTTGSYDNVVYCTVCGEELSRETITVDALGHTKGETVVENKV